MAFLVVFMVLGLYVITGVRISYYIYILFTTSVLSISNYWIYKNTNFYSVLNIVIAPLLVLYVGFLIIRPFPELSHFTVFITGLSERFPDEFPSFDGVLFTLYIIAFFIYLAVPANKIIRELCFELGFFERTKGEDLNEKARTSLKVGAWIGILERGVVLTLVLVGEYTAMAFIIAAKSIIWQKKLTGNKEAKGQPPADYFLVGTLASITLALFAGIILKLVFDY